MGLLAATDEKPYLLKDKQFQMKYKVTIASAIQKAQRRPRLLLAGFSIYPTPHLQPPHETIIKLTEAAGGKVCWGILIHILSLGECQLPGVLVLIVSALGKNFTQNYPFNEYADPVKLGWSIATGWPIVHHCAGMWARHWGRHSCCESRPSNIHWGVVHAIHSKAGLGHECQSYWEDLKRIPITECCESNFVYTIMFKPCHMSH